MAQETLTVQTVDRTGASRALAAVTSADGFKFANDGKTCLVVYNDAGAITLTFAIQMIVDGVTITNVKSVVVTALECWVIGPFPTKWYNDANGDVICTISADLTPAALNEGVVAIKVV